MGHQVLVVEGDSAAKGLRCSTYEIGVNILPEMTMTLPTQSRITAAPAAPVCAGANVRRKAMLERRGSVMIANT